MIGRFDPLTANRPVVRDLEGRARLGVGPRIFFGFNGHDTHWSRYAVPMPGAKRPSRPRCAREGCAPCWARRRHAPIGIRRSATPRQGEGAAHSTLQPRRIGPRGVAPCPAP